jgi:hypothetical protein
VILCTFYTVQNFGNVGSALVISGRISLKLSQKHFFCQTTIWLRLDRKFKKIFSTRPTSNRIGPPKPNFYLWMDFNSVCKIIKDKGGFVFEFFMSTNRTKDKDMRAKNQKPYHFERHFSFLAYRTGVKINLFRLKVKMVHLRYTSKQMTPRSPVWTGIGSNRLLIAHFVGSWASWHRSRSIL